jgi:hypothetical protein
MAGEKGVLDYGSFKERDAARSAAGAVQQDMTSKRLLDIQYRRAVRSGDLGGILNYQKAMDNAGIVPGTLGGIPNAVDQRETAFKSAEAIQNQAASRIRDPKQPVLPKGAAGATWNVGEGKPNNGQPDGQPAAPAAATDPTKPAGSNADALATQAGKAVDSKDPNNLNGRLFNTGTREGDTLAVANSNLYTESKNGPGNEGNVVDHDSTASVMDRQSPADRQKTLANMSPAEQRLVMASDTAVKAGWGKAYPSSTDSTSPPLNAGNKPGFVPANTDINKKYNPLESPIDNRYKLGEDIKKSLGKGGESGLFREAKDGQPSGRDQAYARGKAVGVNPDQIDKLIQDNIPASMASSWQSNATRLEEQAKAKKEAYNAKYGASEKGINDAIGNLDPNKFSAEQTAQIRKIMAGLTPDQRLDASNQGKAAGEQYGKKIDSTVASAKQVLSEVAGEVASIKKNTGDERSEMERATNLAKEKGGQPLDYYRDNKTRSADQLAQSVEAMKNSKLPEMNTSEFSPNKNPAAATDTDKARADKQKREAQSSNERILAIRAMLA